MGHVVESIESRATVDGLVSFGTQDHIMTPPRGDGLLQMIQQNDEKHEESHRRLRQDLDRLEEQVNKGLQSLRDGYLTNQSKIESVAQKPVDATKLILSLPVIVTIVMIALGIGAAFWSVRSELEKLSDKVDTTSKIQELQNNMLKVTIEDMKKRQELKQYDIQDLTNAINAGKSKGR